MDVGTTDNGFVTGIFIPGGDDGGAETRKRAAKCEGCSWHRVPACDYNGWQGYDPVTGAELWEEGVLCAGFGQGCSGQNRYRWDIYLREPGDSNYRRIGAVCLAVGENPVSGAAVAAQVRQYLDVVPLPAMRMQPQANQLVGVPTIFYVDEPLVTNPVHTFAGVTVQVFPRVRYAWDFGDGTTAGPTDEGRPYPEQTITHTYRSEGPATVSVRADWSATFVAFGEEFDLQQTVTRTTSARIVVREARARLQDG